MTNQQKAPNALQLAERISDVPCTSEEDAKAIAAAADELVRLHSENETLQAGYAAARLEIESLQRRVQEVGAVYAALPDDREAFKTYLKECDECAIVPDVAGAFNAAWQIASRGQAPAQQGVQWQCGPQASGFTAPSVLEDAALPEAVIDAVAESLGDAYDCWRVWSAWSYGTMGPDDFSMVAEDGDRVAEIATAAIEAYRAAMAAKKGDAT